MDSPAHHLQVRNLLQFVDALENVVLDAYCIEPQQAGAPYHPHFAQGLTNVEDESAGV